MLSHEWRIADPPQMTHLRSGRHIGARLASLVIERTDALRRMDDYLGGGDLHRLVRKELHVTVSMLREASYSESTGKQLLGAVGELRQLAGWVTNDAGMANLAERYYLGGVSAAHAADNRPLAANLLSSLSYQMANVGDPREAALLASTAYRGAQAEATATTRALLLERLAWANARLGDVEATIRSLGAVNDAFASSNPGDDPIWVYWLSRDEIDIMAGRCYAELHHPGLRSSSRRPITSSVVVCEADAERCFLLVGLPRKAIERGQLLAYLVQLAVPGRSKRSST
jgi:hypothetical protein